MIKIGKLRIYWGEPIDDLRRTYNKTVKTHERIKAALEIVGKRIEELDEPFI
jgi:hypothetical protein